MNPESYDAYGDYKSYRKDQELSSYKNFVNSKPYHEDHDYSELDYESLKNRLRNRQRENLKEEDWAAPQFDDHGVRIPRDSKLPGQQPLEEQLQSAKAALQKARADRRLFLSQLSYVIGSARINETIDTSNVERWAYVDGRNELVDELMELVKTFESKLDEEEAEEKSH